MSGARNPTTAWPERRQPDLGGRGLRDAQHDVGIGVQGIGRDDRRAGRLVGAVGDGRTGAGAVLDDDLEPGRLQLAERFGYQGDTPFSGRGLLGDTDLHGHHLEMDLGC